MSISGSAKGRLLTAFMYICISGCERGGKPAPATAPAPTSASASSSGSTTLAAVAPSASASGSASSMTGKIDGSMSTRYRCVDGVLHTISVDPAAASGPLGESVGDSFGSGGLGLTGTGPGGGRSEGIGLGSVGSSFGHGSATDAGIGAPPRAAGGARALVGDLRSPSSDDGKGPATVLCAATPALRACVDAANTFDKPLVGTASIVVKPKATGAVDSVKVTWEGSADDKVTSCLERAVASLTFEPGTTDIKYDLRVTARRPPAIKMLEVGTTVSGRLPPEVIRRIIRQHFPQLRVCYETLRRSEPTAEGTVITKILIDAKGAVSSVATDAGTLTNPTMRTCVSKVFSALSFPEPEGGVVKVTYPIAFSED